MIELFRKNCAESGIRQPPVPEAAFPLYHTLLPIKRKDATKSTVLLFQSTLL